MRNYFRMTDVEKTREQVTIFRQMRILQKNHYNDELEWLPLGYFYIVNIFNAENNEDYELCQAIKDSAEKHGISLHG